MNSLEKIYYIILISTYFVYIASFIGLISFAPEYLHTLQSVFNLYIAIILILRFHPFKKHKFDRFDQTIIFSAAIFILSTISLSSLVGIFRNPIKNPQDP